MVKRRSWIETFARAKPARFTIYLFLLIVVFFTLLLSLPITTASGERPPLSVAFFTVTSAISGTGFSAEPTGVYWSDFGKVLIMIIIQIGGLGIIMMGSLLGLIVSKRLGLTTRMLTAGEIRESKYGEVGALIKVIAVTTVAIEGFVTACLMPRFMTLHESPLVALWHSLFYAISSFCTAGLDITPDGYMIWGSHWSIVLPLIFGTIMGSIGFPTIRNLSLIIRHRNLRLMTLNTKIVLIAFFTSEFIILLYVVVFEWNNTALFPPSVLADDSSHSAGLVMGALTSRSCGFAAFDTTNLHPATQFLIEIWMFIGGAPASTCAGIKVTTVTVLILAAYSEIKGRDEITFGKKRLPKGSLRVAVLVLIFALAIVITFTFVLSAMTDAPLNVIQFDVISAFAASGMSLGLTNYLNDTGFIVVGILMLIGRLGTMTIAAALMKREYSGILRYPQENVLLG